MTEILHSIGIPLIVIDKKSEEILFTSDKAASLFGDVPTISKLLEKIHPDDSEEFCAVFENSKINGAEASTEFELNNESWKATIIPGEQQITITLIKTADEQVCNRRKVFEKIFDATSDIVLLSDEDFNILQVNQALCNTLNLTKEEVIKLKSIDLHPQLDRDYINGFRSEVEKGKYKIASTIEEPDGTFIDIEVNYFPLKINNKTYYGSVTRDITEYKNIQRELEKANARFELISSSVMEGLWELNLVTKKRWVNDAIRKLYGIAKDGMPPNSIAWERRIHPSMRAKVSGSLKKAIERKDTNWVAEYWFSTAEGSYIYIYDRTLLIYDTNGKLIKMLGSMVNVSELKAAQDELNIQKNLNEGIIKSLPGVFFLLDREGKLLRWNENFEKITGYSGEEISQMTVEKFFYKNEQSGVWKKIYEVFQKGKAEMEANIIHKNGTAKPYYLTGWRTIIGNEEKLIGIGMDISAVKNAQHTVKRMEVKIAEQKIQEQKTISRAIIDAQEKERNHIGRELHDNVNQLLAGARLYLSLGKKKNDEFAELIRYPMELLDEGIKEIRQLTHRNITPSKDINLEELIEGIKEMLKAASIECQFSYEVKTPMSEKLLINVYRIMQEQANNIIKHSQASKVTVKIYDKNRFLHIEITDNGIGFDVNSVKEGIGLYNIYSRVEAYNGKIDLHSKPGKGCCTSIKIPTFETLYD